MAVSTGPEENCRYGGLFASETVTSRKIRHVGSTSQASAWKHKTKKSMIKVDLMKCLCLGKWGILSVISLVSTLTRFENKHVYLQGHVYFLFGQSKTQTVQVVLDCDVLDLHVFLRIIL